MILFTYTNTRLCSDLFMDIVEASNLANSFPGRILLVKYEELVSTPEKAMRIILKVSYIFLMAEH